MESNIIMKEVDLDDNLVGDLGLYHKSFILIVFDIFQGVKKR